MDESLCYENAAFWHSDRYNNDPAAFKRFSKVLEMIPDSTTSILDAGCGNGHFLRLLEENGFQGRLTGLERSAAAIEHSVCQSKINQGSLDAMPFPDDSFELITAQEVIEHLPHGAYGKALLELQRVTAKHIMVSVPYREKRIWTVCSYCGCRFNPWYHQRTFDRKRMENLFDGFSLVDSALVYIRQVIFREFFWKIYKLFTGRTRAIRALRCPQCGYSPEPSAARENKLREDKKRRNLARRILPTRKVANNIVCLYRKT